MLSDVFTVVWRRIGEAGSTTERAWIYGIARNVIRNHRRTLARQGRLTSRVGSLRHVGAADPSSLAIQGETSDAVLSALQTLRPRDQEILILSAWDELSGPEMAEILGVSTNAVQQRLHRAKARLAKALPDTMSGRDQG